MANGGIIGPVVTPPNVQTQSAPGVWTLQEAQEYIRQGLWPRRYDPLFNYTTLLLSGNGSNLATNNSFQDSSTNNFPITRNGNTTQGTFSPFSQTGWGNYFDGTSDYLSVADNSVLRLGTSAFTIECWVYRAANGTAHSIVAKGGASTGWLLEVTSGNVLQFTHTTTAIATSLPVYAGNWVHVAAVREGTGSNQFKLYINGTLAKTDTVATDFTQTDTLYIGANRSAATSMNGYISNLRITNGTALYTAQFTPSTTALTTTSQGALAAQVELLTCQSNRFVDNSGNGFTVTRNGDTSIQAFSPFNATTPWDPNLYGGSGYFDGTGDFLSSGAQTAFNVSGGNWTIEFWMYCPSTPSTTVIAENTSNGTNGWSIQINSSAQPVLYVSSNIITSSNALVAGQWNHLAFVRNSSTTTFYLNGVSSGTSASDVGTTNGGLWIGARSGGSFGVSGYLGDFRIVKGTAVYTSAFTPPTAPLTNITNTSLLLNFTNGGVFDATSKNALETVGNAQISTAQSQFGGSSIAFDGSGDYLLTNVASSDLYAFGSGDWTIECWVYFNNLTGDGIIYDGKLADGAYPTIYRSTSTIIYYTNGANRITSGTISATTWYHVAVSRSGTSVKLFINGVQAGSTYTDSQTYLCPANRPVIGAAGSSGFVGAASLNGYLQDLRVTKGYARYTANFAVPDSAFPTLGSTPPSVDPYFDYTTLLLPGSGTNNATNNSFLDSSANNFTITRNGNTTQGTFSPFSQTGWGNYFDGNGDYLSSPYGTGFNLTGDFTIECWVNASYLPTATGSGTQLFPRIFSFGTYNAANSLGLEVNTNDPGFVRRLVVWYNGTSYNSGTNNDVTTNQWYHLAVVRNGTVITIYKDGAVSFSITGASAAVNTSQAFYIATLQGFESNTSACWNGYISNLRVVKGRAVYTAAFTPPTSPLTRTTGGTNPPQGTECSLLTCQSNRFLDSNGVNISASSPLTITVNGNTSVQAFSPFNPTASWSAATNGGSGYFDGTGDYLNGIGTTSSFNFMHNSSSLFTFEAWLFRTATGGATQILFTNSDQTSSNIGVAISIESGVPLLYITRGVAASVVVSASAATAIPVGAWSYIAVTYDQSLGSNNAKWYVNGTLDSQTSKTANAPSGSNATNAASVGGNSTGTSPFTGYISNIRISNVIRTISTPTTPYTNDANTSLLLGFTNAGIYDATSKNDLETVADAKISTAQSVWTAYGASMAFDETGDYLTLPASQNVALGSGDFTIECWARFAASTVSNGMGLFQLSSGYLNSQVRGPAAGADNTTGRWSIYYGTSSTVHASLAPSTNTWYHVAFVRASGTSKLYVDGTEIISVSDSTNYTDTYFTVGGWYSSSFLLNGYLQDLRVTKGIARYTANFQPPSAPLALR